MATIKINPIFVDDSSHLTAAQQKEINGIIRSEYNRFQRKAYQKPNNAEPLILREGKVASDLVSNFKSRKYDKINLITFTLDTAKFEAGKAYKIISGLSGMIICYGDSNGDLLFYTEKNTLIVYSNSNNLKQQTKANVTLSN